MKRLKKSIFATMLIFALLLSHSLIIYAADTKPSVSYDMEKGGTQVFHTEDADGNEVIITVEELSSVSRVSNGSYKVSYDYPLMWEAGFTIDVSGNKITRAYSPFRTVALGSITNASLTLNSSTKATYKFIHKVGFISTTTGVVATISGTTLEVSKY